MIFYYNTLPSYLKFVSNRIYLSDYKQLSDRKYATKQLALLVLKAAALESNKLMLKYTKHMENSLEAEKNDEEVEPFDMDDAVSSHIIGFSNMLLKGSVVFLFKKWIESIVVHKLPIKYADKLTKDIQLSARRKLTKYHKLDFLKKMVRTVSFAQLPLSLATIVGDFCELFYKIAFTDFLSNQKNKVTYIGKCVLKICFTQTLSIVFTSLAFSTGCFVDSSYTPQLLAALGDLLAVSTGRTLFEV